MPISKILVANRSEIAIRVFRAANELGLKTVAIWAEEDKYSLHRFKADESYQVGRGPHLGKDLGPIESYLSIEEVLRVARLSGADAIHPGYGLLSESPEFAEACAAAGIVFIGPKPETMRRLGNKVAARNLAVEVGVPVVPATEPLPDDIGAVKKLAAEIGYPLMLKASWGGGGRGMRAIRSEADLMREVTEGKREAKAAFGKDEVYLEKLIERARHVEVQILGDTHGNAVHLFERDCSIQRRNQKVVERAPAPYLSQELREELCGYALKLARDTAYIGAGTVEFLQDADTGKFYFIEVNPRIQVEHTVTEEVTGIDIVKAQIHLLDGAVIGTPESGVPSQENIRLNGNAIQCRVTTEDPEQNFIPDYGRITAYRGATGFGVRLDGKIARSHLVAELPHGFRRRPDEDDAGVATGLGKLRAFRQEAIARVNGVGLGLLGDPQDLGNAEIGFDRPQSGTDPIGLVGLEAVQRQPILLGKDGNRLQAELIGGAENADGDFGSVGDKHLGDRHGKLHT